MDLILWRHAEAEDAGPDLERRLTARGEQQAAKVAAFLRPRVPKGTRILVSPALRARQTAAALSKHFDVEAKVGPGSDPTSVLKAAGWPEGQGSTLIVGHQPYLGEIAALLLANDGVGFNLGKGAVWWFTWRDGETILRLVVTPDLA